MNEFKMDQERIRQEARANIDKGPITASYGGDAERVVQVCNQALASEIVCVLRYKRHYFTAAGLNSNEVAAEFLEHANSEQEHADMLAQRIVQLGGDPDLDPANLATRSVTDYDSVAGLREMITEDLVAERVVISTYTELIRWLGEADPTTRRIFESLLADEEEHADDLQSLLERVS
jgi:bacterioferritin